MPILQSFTDQQNRFDRAFAMGGSCCTAHCEACGRTYFVTSPGHGDYEEGELDLLYKRATEQPDKYIEVSDFGSVSTVDINGKNVVVGCLCDPTKKLSTWIEFHAEQLTTYLRMWWEHRIKETERATKEAREAQLALAPRDGKGDWLEMKTAPKTAKWVEVLLADGVGTRRAHWASDLSGEEQPPFQGWFYESSSGFRQVTPAPIAWRELPTEKSI